MNKRTATILYIFLGVMLVSAGAYVAFSVTQPKNRSMPLHLPKDSDTAQLPQKANLTLVLGRDDVYYYEGVEGGKLISLKDVRHVLINCKRRDSNLFVVIKPTEKSTYQNTVDILDEMTINNIKRYAMVDPDPTDLDKYEWAKKQ